MSFMYSTSPVIKLYFCNVSAIRPVLPGAKHFIHSLAHSFTLDVNMNRINTLFNCWVYI